MINPNEGLPRYGLSGAYGSLMVGFSLILMIPYFRALKQSHVINHLGQVVSVAAGRASALVAARLGLARVIFSARIRVCAAGDFLGVIIALRSSTVVARAIVISSNATRRSRLTERFWRRR